MTDCPNGVIRDLLPEYVHGVLAADAMVRVDAHLDGCAECRDEVRLLKNARAALALFAPTMDVASIAAALPAARHSARRAPRRFPMAGTWQFAAAAALVLAVGSSVLWRSAPEQMAPRVADSSSATVGSGTATAALPAGSPASVPQENGLTFGGGLSDLSLDDLQLLLGQMDSVRALPSIDPASMTPVITMNEGGSSL